MNFSLEERLKQLYASKPCYSMIEERSRFGIGVTHHVVVVLMYLQL